MAEPRMKPEEFARIATYRYGAQWKKPISRELQRSPKMIRMYATGKAPIPEGIARQLRLRASLGPIGDIIRNAVVEQMTSTVRKPGQHRMSAERLGYLIACQAIDEIADAVETEERPIVTTSFNEPKNGRLKA